MDYVIADPAKNITVLVKDPVPREDYAGVAARLLEEIPDAEQVGFLIPPKREDSGIAMCMMGGEFCGNATMSAAAYAALQDGIGPGEETDIRIETSGAEDVLVCHITGCAPSDSYRERTDGLPGRTDVLRGTLGMPLPRCISEYGGHPAVCFDGITHVILERPAEEEADLNRAEIERQIRTAAEELAVPALGFLLWDEDRSYMVPCVYVRDTDSLVWERGCASGSAAVGTWRSMRDGRSEKTAVRQPGGLIEADASYGHEHITRLSITGRVAFLPR